MFNISDFLAKFQKMNQAGLATRDAAAKVLSDVLGIPVLSKDIKIKNSTLYLLGGSSVLKSQLFIKKQELLTLLKEAGITTIQDIR